MNKPVTPPRTVVRSSTILSKHQLTAVIGGLSTRGNNNPNDQAKG